MPRHCDLRFLMQMIDPAIPVFGCVAVVQITNLAEGNDAAAAKSTSADVDDSKISSSNAVPTLSPDTVSMYHC